MGVRLRRSRAADLGAVVALERDPRNRELIGQWTDARHAAAIARERGQNHWIIERDGAFAGYLVAYDGAPRYPGMYVKRILVADKERGTGTAALSAFLDSAFASPGVEFVWLLVLPWNARAQAVYRKLGFEPFALPGEIEATILELGDGPAAEAIAMRLSRTSRRGSG